jgi:hypothetical protein
MIIKDTLYDNEGTKHLFEYHDVFDFYHLKRSLCTQAYGVCFYKDKIVIGYGGKLKKAWGLIGGTIEKGESYGETLKREIKEESNMKILWYKPIGYQKILNTKTKKFGYQLRYVCTVEPYGEFIKDPDNSIVKIKLIDPTE